MSLQPDCAYQCTYCLQWFLKRGQNIGIDHFIPKSKGGTNHSSNRLVACKPCNSIKSNILFETVEEAREYIRKFKEGKTFQKYSKLLAIPEETAKRKLPKKIKQKVPSWVKPKLRPKKISAFELAVQAQQRQMQLEHIKKVCEQLGFSYESCNTGEPHSGQANDPEHDVVW